MGYYQGKLGDLTMITNPFLRIGRLIKKLRDPAHLYYSQGGEDVLINRVFSGDQEGFYIDVGAHDPVHYSNTYRLYCRGWRGLCLEPNHSLHPRFKELRPRDHLIAVAAGKHDGTALFHLGHHTVHSSLTHSANRHGSSVEIPVRRLESLLDELMLHHRIDLLSVDTEGTEIEVLEGLNLSRYRPRLIVLEYNTASVINREAQSYLIHKGYQILGVTCWNVIATDRLEEDYRVLCPKKGKG